MPEVKILENKKIKDRYYKITISAKQIAKSAKPGQFLEIKVSETSDPLLRRPLGIHRVRGSSIVILYEVVGRGTVVLSQRKPGEYLDVIGPLGNGFSLDGRVNGQTILVAGGMGVAPLIFLAEKLAKGIGHRAKGKSLVLIGAKTKNKIICEKEFKDLGCEVKTATEDGSRGFKGRVTELLKKLLPLTISHKPLAIYACGPRPMLKEVSLISKKYNLPAQISLEEHLACGIGACLGCVVNTRNGYQRVCKEGPVFEAGEIVW